MRYCLISLAFVLLAGAAIGQTPPYPAPVGSPPPAPTPAPRPAPAPTPAPVPTTVATTTAPPAADTYDVVEATLVSDAQAATWLKQQAKSRRALIGVIPRGAAEKTLFIFMRTTGAIEHMVVASPDLSKENVATRIRAQHPKTFLGACRAGSGYLLFFK
ncbi:MAG: hypothetical protein AABO58_19940 [Acidobacteriota bacterium]